MANSSETALAGEFPPPIAAPVAPPPAAEGPSLGPGGYVSLCAGVAAALALLALVGWAADISVLRSGLPGGPPMKTNTALCLILAAAALWLPRSEPGSLLRWLAGVAATAVALLSGLTLAQHITGADAGIDRLVFGGAAAASGGGRTSPAGATCLLLLSAALLAACGRASRPYGSWPALAAATVAAGGLLRFAFGIGSEGPAAAYQTTAVNTLAAVLALSAGVLALRPADGPAAVLLSDSAGGFMARRLLPAIAAALFAAGFVCLRGEEAGLYGPEFAAAMLVLAGTAASAALVTWNARALERIDSERRRAEAALREPQERFARFMQNLPGLAFIKDADGRYVYVNHSFESVFRLKPSDWPGRTDYEIFPAGIAAQFVANDRAVLSTGRVLQTVEVAPHDDGPHHSIVSKFPIPGPGGGPVLLGGIAVDITERRRAEETLRRSEQHQQVAVEAAKLGTWRLDAGFGRIEASARCLAHFGLPRDAQVDYGMFLSYVHPGDRDHVDGAIRRAFATGTVYEAEYRTVRPDGGLHWISASGRAVAAEGGRPPEMFGVTQDITDRKRDEERLREENRLVETLNRIGAAVSGELDLDKLVQAVTDEGTRLAEAQFGAFFYNVTDERGESYTLYALSGVPREAFAKFPMPRNTAIFEPTFRGSGPVRLDDVTRDPRYGRNPPYSGMPEGHLPVRSYLAVPVISRTGEALGGLFFGHPDPGVFSLRHERLIVGIAAQAAIAIDNARLYREARRANRIKDEFLAVVSHELRTPLNAILGWSQLLRSGALSDEETRHGLDVIDRSVRAQTQIISDLLDVGRIVAGKLNLEMKPAALPAVIEGAVESVRLAAAAKGLTLEAACDPEAAQVFGDADRLRQVVSNLLSNAVKFTPAGGRIDVRVRRVGNNARINVADTGKGIPPAFLPHVFERFRQADDAATRRSHGGLGLGLAIVRHLVELHRGTVRVDSNGEGRGATFTVELPLADRAIGAPSPGGRPAGAADLSGLKVLAVDDEADARELLATVLRRAGAEVTIASSVAEALAEMQRRPPDVLLSDVGMPGRDGFDLILAVRSLPADRGGRIPAAALTAFAARDDRERLLAAGFQTHVTKPIDATALPAIVAELAGERR